MKKTRRGGLGRGLGALIQSTADLEEAISTADEPAEAETSPDTAETPTKASTASSSTTDGAGDTPRAAAATTITGTGTAGRTSKAGKTSATKASAVKTEKKAASTTKAASGASAASSSGKGSSATAKRTAPAAMKDTVPTRSTKTSSSTRGSRPVDLFFSSQNADEDTDSSTTSSSRSTPRRTSSRNARPSMPTVSAPSRKKSAPAAEQQPAPQKATVSPDIAVLRDIKVTDIHPNPRQPREVFDEDHMAELVASIAEVGILQPVVVREVDGETPYELIMGERRWRATQLAGLETIPAIVRHTPDEDLLRDALLENLHRSQLNPLEEAAAYQQLMDDFQCTQEELSQRIGRSRPQISNTLRLMKLPPLVQRRVAAGTLTAGHARALLGLSDPAEMERLAQKIVAEGLSVRATEDAVALAQGVRQAAPVSRRTSDPTRHERLDYFATALTARLDTQVKITLGKRKGKIAIDFASVEDLNRIMGLIQGDGTQSTA